MSSIFEKPIGQISEADLQHLIDRAEQEGQRLEFKTKLDLANERAKQKLAKAVVSFANVPGGEPSLIIVGIEEAHRNGVKCASGLTPLDRDLADDIDNVIDGQVGSDLRREIRTIPSAQQKDKVYCLVRVWTSPDRLFSVNGTFYVRTPKGARRMPTAEVSSRYERIFERRRGLAERIARVQVEEFPKGIKSWFGILVIPELATGDVDIGSLDNQTFHAPDGWRELMNSQHLTPSDRGFESTIPADATPEEMAYLVRLRRDGILHVGCHMHSGTHYSPLVMIGYAVGTIRLAKHLFPRIGLSGPVRAIALIRNDGPLTNPDDWAPPPQRRFIPIGQRFAEHLMPAGPDDGWEFARKAMNRVAEATGVACSPYFDQSGKPIAKVIESLRLR